MIEHFYEVYAEMRRSCPVAHTDAHEGFWVVSRYEDVVRVMGDPESFSSSQSMVLPKPDFHPSFYPAMAAGETHREYRRFLNPHFSAAKVRTYEDGIREVVTALIDEFIENGQCEFVRQFARPLPATVFFRQVLDLPEDDLDAVFETVASVHHQATEEERQGAQLQLLLQVAELLARRRGEPRRDDVIDAILFGDVAGRPLSDEEAVTTVFLLIMGGLDTTAHTLANIIRHLATRPGLRARLEGEPELIPRAIEEFLRYEAVASEMVRFTTREAEVAGQTIPVGEYVLVSLASANRDERVWAEADEIDLDRDRKQPHVAFGYGAHFCIGAHLARLELRVALEEILARVHDIRIDETVPIEWETGHSRGPTFTAITFVPGPRRLPEAVAAGQSV